MSGGEARSCGHRLFSSADARHCSVFTPIRDGQGVLSAYDGRRINVDTILPSLFAAIAADSDVRAIYVLGRRSPYRAGAAARPLLLTCASYASMVLDLPTSWTIGRLIERLLDAGGRRV